MDPRALRSIAAALRRVVPAILAAGALAGCAAVGPTVPADPTAHPRVYRSVFEGRPGMLGADLGQGVWISYDTRNAALYRIWPGGIRFEGAVYDSRHGPQPTAVGPAWTLRTGESAWRLIVGGEPVVPEIRYLGHRRTKGGLILSSELRYEDLVIAVEEEVRRAAGAAPGVEWRLRRGAAPPDVEVRWEVSLDSLGAPPEVEAAEASWRGEGGRRRGTLGIAAGAQARLVARFGEPTIAASVDAGTDASWRRFEELGCPSCHATDVRTVGPSLVEIAHRYDADARTIESLAKKVRQGGRGVWGEVPMPANDFIDPAEAEDLVSFVLALDGEDAAARRRAGDLRTGRSPSLLAMIVEHGPGLVAEWFSTSVAGLFSGERTRPGDGAPLEGVHPAFVLEDIRPPGFEPRVGGMAFLGGGDLLVSTWDSEGAVYRVSGLGEEQEGGTRVRQIARGLAEPLGLAVVDDEIFVLQKHELTRLVDHDGDGVTDEYRTISNDWQSSGNFHEFAFGLVPDGDGFLATLSSGVAPGGNSAIVQPADRGSVIRIAADGRATAVARGLRTPNGIGRGKGGEVFVADNQGAWLPASKIVHVRPGAFFGFRDVDPQGDAHLVEAPPVVWLPQNDIGNSPSEPVAIDLGPYRGQLLHGDVTHGGIKRVFYEPVDGSLQGAVFRFSQGIEAGVNRLRWGPDGKLYVGGIGNPGNWGHAGGLWHGLQRLAYRNPPPFEMLAVRARPDGFEIEWTRPVATGGALDPDAYRIRQWRYEPTADYGGPRLDLEDLEVSGVELSADHRRARLRIEGLEAGSVVHLRLDPDRIEDARGHRLWTTEAWYTLNRIPVADGPEMAGGGPVSQRRSGS